MMAKSFLSIKVWLWAGVFFAPVAYAEVVSPSVASELGSVFVSPAMVDLVATPMASVPTPQYQVSGVVRLPTVRIAKTVADDGQWLDTTVIDDFIDDISPNARHYPPNFPNRTMAYHVGNNIDYLLTWLKPFADQPDASFEVLLRAAQLAIMGRNMGVSEYAPLASDYLARALRLQPDDVEVNVLYGVMLSEGGGFAEGKVYLDKAASLGSLEAKQSLIQAMLIAGDGDKQAALAALRALAMNYPDNAQILKQIQIIENGGYYIWKIEDNQLRVKPFS